MSAKNDDHKKNSRCDEVMVWRFLADINAKFHFALFFLTSMFRVNVLVKGSPLIRALSGLTSPNPIQWTFYTANAVCPPHDCMQSFRILYSLVK